MGTGSAGRPGPVTVALHWSRAPASAAAGRRVRSAEGCPAARRRPGGGLRPPDAGHRPAGGGGGVRARSKLMPVHRAERTRWMAGPSSRSLCRGRRTRRRRGCSRGQTRAAWAAAGRGGRTRRRSPAGRRRRPRIHRPDGRRRRLQQTHIQHSAITTPVSSHVHTNSGQFWRTCDN